MSARALPFLLGVERDEDRWVATATVGEWTVWKALIPAWMNEREALDEAEEAFAKAFARGMGNTA